MAVKEYHVDTDGKGHWHIRRGDQEKPFAFYPSIDAAESAARALAHLNEAVVVVHDKGNIRRTDYRGLPV